MADELQGEADSGQACPGTNIDGSACRVPAGLLLDSGYCFSHDPDVPEAERLAAKRNGAATMRLKLTKGLASSELGSLETAEDAQRWGELITRATLTGRISAGTATAATQALREWRNARDLAVRENQLAKVVEVLKAEGRL